MVSFKEFLIEARESPLYHGAGPEGISILKDKAFHPNTRHPSRILLKHGDINDYRTGLSTSRSKRYARSWANMKGNGYHKFLFELDHRRLTHRYEIIPVNYFNAAQDRAEMEEFVISKEPISLDYVTKITMNVQASYDISKRHPALWSWLKDDPRLEVIMW